MRTFPCTEQELHIQRERKVAREIKRQQAAAEAAVNMASTKQMEAYEADMAAHLAHQAMAVLLAAGATPEAPIAAGHVISDAITGVGGSLPMHD